MSEHQLPIYLLVGGRFRGRFGGRSRPLVSLRSDFPALELCCPKKTDVTKGFHCNSLLPCPLYFFTFFTLHFPTLFIPLSFGSSFNSLSLLS